MTGDLTLEHFTDDDVAVLRKWFDDALRREQTHGGIKDWRMDVRRDGFTLHVTVHDEVDLSLDATDPVSMEARHMANDWHMFAVVARKLLALPDDYEPPEGDRG